MRPDQRELANRLFTIITEVLEDSAVCAVKGQSAKITAGQAHTLAREIRSAGQNIIACADAALVVIGRSKQTYRP